MASGYAGGVAALVLSRHPRLSPLQLRQVLSNTATGQRWDPQLGWGILDAHRAVSVDAEDLRQRLRVDAGSCRLTRSERRLQLTVRVVNHAAFDVTRALLVAFNGDPEKPAAPHATRENPVILVTKQIGHTMGPVRGFHAAEFSMEIAEAPGDNLYLQVCSCDHHGAYEADTVRISPEGIRREV